MEKQHTEGPWTRYKLEATRNEHGVYFSPVGRQFVTNELRRDGVLCASAFGRTKGEAEANARLIAAAPDLLEALEKLLDHVTVDSLRTNWEDVIKLTTSAIAKSKDL